MVIDHADGLHESIDDGAADEIEAALFKIFAQGIGDFGAGRHIGHGFRAVPYWHAINVTPEIGIERTKLVDDAQGAISVLDTGFHF